MFAIFYQKQVAELEEQVASLSKRLEMLEQRDKQGKLAGPIKRKFKEGPMKGQPCPTFEELTTRHSREELERMGL